MTVGHRIPSYTTRAPAAILLVAGMGGTATAADISAESMDGIVLVAPVATSTSGATFVDAATDSATKSSAAIISELRRISGLTWDQLGTLFDVSRRAVHFWASGKPLNITNERRLRRVLAVVRAADRGHARANKTALLESRNGTSPFDLLVAQRFHEARNALGPGKGRARPLPRLSREARDARRPLPPADLVDATSERIHHDTGRARAARTVRNKSRGDT